MRRQILPPLKDVHTRPEEGSTLRNCLCRLLTSPITHVKDLSAEFLFILCKHSGMYFEVSRSYVFHDEKHTANPQRSMSYIKKKTQFCSISNDFLYFSLLFVFRDLLYHVSGCFILAVTEICVQLPSIGS